MLVRWLACAAALFASMASAQSDLNPSVDGWGRISVVGGYRWVPNWYFFDHAAAKGEPVVKASLGGPQLDVSFGYGAASWLEVAVDLFGAVDWFELEGRSPFTAFTYGGLLGPRVTSTNVLFPGFTPYLGAEVGPTFVLLQSSSVSTPERLIVGFAVVGGFHWRFADHWALSVDVRWLLARGLSEVSGFNAGGVLFSAGVSYLFPPALQREPPIPGFGAPSRL